MGTAPALSAPDGPLAVVGNVTYNYIGSGSTLSAQDDASTANFYSNYLEGDLLDGGISIGARGDALESVKQMRETTNQLNNGLGGWDPDVDANGNFFGGRYIQYTKELPQVPYRVDATMNVFQRPENSERFDMNFNATIVDVKTGEVVGHASAWKRDTEMYVNEKIIGPEPTWYERYISGYVREITFENPLRTAIAEASKQITEQLSDIAKLNAVPDSERFFKKIKDQQEYMRTLAESGYRPLVPDEVRNPKSESAKTAWGDAVGYETAYENYFWIYVQGHDMSTNFWDLYNEENAAFVEYWRTLPLGGPVDLREYFKSASAKGRYEQLREAQIDGHKEHPESEVLMPPFDEFLANINSYQANLDMAKPPEKAPVPPVEQDNDDTSNPEVEETLRRMRECYSRPLPQTEAEREEQLRQDMDPSSPCYNPQIKLCNDGSYGLCMNDTPSGGWTESR